MLDQKKILARRGGGTNVLAAAGAIRAGLYVAYPRHSDVIFVGFEYPDRSVVQPVLNEVIKIYLRKHVEVHQGLGLSDDYYAKERDQLRDQLAATEKKLEELMRRANVVSIEDTKKTYVSQISKLMDELLTTKTQLAEHKALLGDVTSEVGTTNDLSKLVPQDKLDEYTAASTRLTALLHHKQDLLLQFTEAHPEVQAVQRQIDDLRQKKSSLEQAYPAIAQLASTVDRVGNNVGGVDIASEMAQIKTLSAKADVLEGQLSNVQADASSVVTLEPQVAQLQRQRDLEEQHYRFYSSSLEQAREGELSAGKVTNISIVESPTPPIRDRAKLLKLVAAVFGGAIGLGLGLAFLVDFILDRTIKRAADVKRGLRLPLLISIPDLYWNGRIKMPSWLPFAQKTKKEAEADKSKQALYCVWAMVWPRGTANTLYGLTQMRYVIAWSHILKSMT